MSEILIRPMKQSDLGKVADVYVRAYERYRSWEHWTPVGAKNLFKYWLKRQPDLAYVATIGTSVVGAMTVGVKPWWDGNHLVDGELVVDTTYQNRRIGSQLLSVVLEKAVKKYHPTVWEAVTFKKTDFPLSWYRRLGFREIQEWALISGNVPDITKLLEKPQKGGKTRF